MTKNSDGIGIKILIVGTCRRLLDRNEIVKKCIDYLNNSVHLLMENSKKVVEILIDYIEKKSMGFVYEEPMNLKFKLNLISIA